MQGHKLQAGDTVSVMDYGRNAYRVAVVTYYRHGEAVNLRETFDGSDFTMLESELHAMMAQALHHHGTGPDRPTVGIVGRADGTVHHITGTGACLQCSHTDK